MTGVINVLSVLRALVPIARDIARAMKKDSDGGKKITADELAEILFRRAPDALDDLNGLVEKRGGR